MIERALDQGFLPDTISTDLTLTTATRGMLWSSCQVKFFPARRVVPAACRYSGDML